MQSILDLLVQCKLKETQRRLTAPSKSHMREGHREA
jgi:hypothetical protein